MRLIEKCGYFWPPHSGNQHKASIRRTKSLLVAASWCTQNGRNKLVVQAGGSVGVWPIILSKFFGKVITFEPEPISYECLKRNVKASNVTMHPFALGEKQTRVGIQKRSLTAHRVVDGDNVLSVTVNEMDLTDCDAILLDIEGGEYKALLGSSEVIKNFKPLILFEALDKPMVQLIDKFLCSLGYSELSHVHMDKIYVPN